MHWFDYSIIRYMPNPKRGEIVNLGLVIFRASGIDIRMLNASTKARILDGTTDYEDIVAVEDVYKEISEYSESPEDQYSVIKSFGSGVFISEKNSFSIQKIMEYQDHTSLDMKRIIQAMSF